MSPRDTTVADARARTRARASIRHPVRWVGSHLGHRRGVTAAAPEPTSTQEVLDRLCRLQISTWTYGFDHESVRHLGPMAQDFAAAFGLGANDRHIDAVDANGVCMASIQALQKRIAALEAELARATAGAAAVSAPPTEKKGSNNNQ
ncbi:tail fiber domain-containing protein [Rhodococcus sp. KBS0724]|nr:tail fiber domain-containing protein [Rhodococcus sp. KBS0724]